MKDEVRSDKGGVLVCFAVKEEACSFRKLAAAQPQICVLITGMGRKNAEKSVREFLSSNSPRLVLTCGFAGALNPALNPGATIFSTDDKKLCEQLLAAKAMPAKFFCSGRIAITVAEKTELRRSTGADAVEMESEMIQAICLERKIPCATVRAISDTAGEDLPLDFNQLCNPDMNLDYSRLAWAIIKSPGKVAGLMRLQKRCRIAAKKLADVLGKIIFQ